VANSGSNTVSVLLGNGDGTFQSASNFPAGRGPVSVAVGDFNGDGKLDLSVAFSLGVRVLLGNGDGTFKTTNISYLAGRAPAAVAVADLNGDGWADLAVANYDSNDVSILLNDDTWPAGPPPGSAPRSPGHPPKPLATLAALTDWPGRQMRTEPGTRGDEGLSSMTGKGEAGRPLDLYCAGQRLSASGGCRTETPSKLVLAGSGSRTERAFRELPDLVFADWEDGEV
jgi:hypothetical protein